MFARRVCKYVSLKGVHKVARVKPLSWGASRMLVSGHWSGILGTHPGAASGSQTIEAFHSFWQRCLQAATRSRIDAVMPTMQRLFTETWYSKFVGRGARQWSLYARQWSPVFVQGQQLRSMKRSPAADYWVHRDKTNYQRIVHETAPASLAPKHTATFWVVPASPLQGTVLAETSVDRGEAERIVQLIMSEGNDLTAKLKDAGVVSGGPDEDKCCVDAARLQHFFHDHAVVMEGQLIDSYWPRMRKGTLEPAPAIVCTCWSCLLCTECEHVVFVHALCGAQRCRPHIGAGRRDGHG